MLRRMSALGESLYPENFSQSGSMEVEDEKRAEGTRTRSKQEVIWEWKRCWG